MSALGVLRLIEGGDIAFWCEGCEEMHAVPTQGSNPWQWNGNGDKPTITPSVLIRSGHHIPGFAAGKNCWCTWNQKHPDNPTRFKCRICHCIVTNGMIQFCDDSTHHLKGQTVPLKAPQL